MSAPPPRGAGQAAGTVPLTLEEAVGLAVPLVFVVEPDALWAVRAIEALLDASADLAMSGSAAERVVARWTRTARWTAYGYSFGLGLPGPESAEAGVDVLDELIRLGEQLGGGRRAAADRHPLDGALFSVRGLASELERPAAAEILLGLVVQLGVRGATLLVELDLDPRSRPAWGGVAALGPAVGVPDTPALRYENAIRHLRAAADAGGGREPLDADRVYGAFRGMTRLQAEVAARAVRARVGTACDTDVFAALAEARSRVGAAIAGAAG
ncbi:hypothetical protein [Longimicrobium terrae]|uniref:Uncharacterized protein n=1 Tax=Longimicrobium terrae TaxID=1639882 RepID=A0A841GX80_9BACT|nr:hypothetical protein [Longimicrobium terrae]MBB4636009.1 hypothetical protein [Longimicrobium terrae]MBB6070405.1 hypothetical protein [Longimicrobium terrae]NNC30899.1 hypothetical protein [Longimicrobium terrae]